MTNKGLKCSSSTYSDSISPVLRKPLANTFQKFTDCVKISMYLLKSKRQKPTKQKQKASGIVDTSS